MSDCSGRLLINTSPEGNSTKSNVGPPKRKKMKMLKLKPPKFTDRFNQAAAVHSFSTWKVFPQKRNGFCM